MVFVCTLERNFLGKPALTEEQKIAMLTSQLTGVARAWAEDLWREGGTLTANYSAFIVVFTFVFTRS